jgi:hypothetical protein
MFNVSVKAMMVSNRKMWKVNIAYYRNRRGGVWNFHVDMETGEAW